VIFLYNIFLLLHAKHKLLHVEQWRNSELDQLKVTELKQLRMTGAGTQFRRVPPYYDHWLLHYPGRYEHSYDPTHLNSSLASLLSVAKF